MQTTSVIDITLSGNIYSQAIPIGAATTKLIDLDSEEDVTVMIGEEPFIIIPQRLRGQYEGFSISTTDDYGFAHIDTISIHSRTVPSPKVVAAFIRNLEDALHNFAYRTLRVESVAVKTNYVINK